MSVQKEIAKVGDAEWMEFVTKQTEEGKFASEIPPANFMARNFSNYQDKLMIVPQIDFNRTASDTKGNKYFINPDPRWRGFVIEFNSEITDKLRKFASVIGAVGTEGWEMVCRIKDVFGWWNNNVFLEAVAVRVKDKVTAFFADGKANFSGEDIMQKYLDELKESSSADIPKNLDSIPDDLEPLTVAKLFYHLCTEEDNHDVWSQILHQKECTHNGQPLPRVKSWWNNMKKDRSYYYVRTDQDDAEVKKYFFQMAINGEDNGNPKPIQVKMENGQWRVLSASC